MNKLQNNGIPIKKNAQLSIASHNVGDLSETNRALYLQRIRSFVRRSGRSSKAQKRAFESLGPQFKIAYQSSTINWLTAFGRDNCPRILEIGFGMGETTAHIARNRPNEDFIAVEVHEPGIGALLKLIGQIPLSNIRIIQHDAVEVVENMLSEASIDGVHIFFPDPWHKKRHHKRRLLQSPFVALLASRLKPGGYVHCATDWQEYAEQILEVLNIETSLKNITDHYTTRPNYRPVTKFENRGVLLGHKVWDIVFQKKFFPNFPNKRI
ncbi:tRNA (guanosine(46)-N7)-methyltransferase TrmB [Candidatus Pandoraea novymonadis]|nr:tRNA (guanosine(46)-N7)-methyltransferase TrmB [Candidatus Pandoraea novymonadis]